jgi:hypothetical protein
VARAFYGLDNLAQHPNLIIDTLVEVAPKEEINMRELTRGLLYAALLALVVSATTIRARALSDLGPPDLAVMQDLQTTYGWGPVFGWPANTNPCPSRGVPWNGVTCSNGRVNSIIAICGTTLLNAPIPPILSQLTAMTNLNVRNCGVTGPIPDGITTMTQLGSLRLDDNVLSGTIPPAFATFPSLANFSLVNNLFTGAIPQFPNDSFVIIRLGGNFLTEIPAAWTQFNRDVSYNCYPSLPPSCDSQSVNNECTPNRQDCPSTMILSKVSGDGQRTQINTAFANPLAVSVTDLSNNPVEGATVTFSGPGISTVTAMTDSTGSASANVTANSTVGGNTITASVDPNTMVSFGLTAGAAATCSANIGVTSNGASGPGTLMEALADVCPGGTIDLSGINGQTIVPGGRLYIATDVTIQGSGVTISGGGATRIFFVQNGNVTLSNLVLANGLGQGGSSNFGGSGGGLGGAIFENNGNLTLNGVVLSGNQAVGGSPDSSGTGAGGGFGANSTGGDLGGAVGTSDGAGGIVQGVGGIGGFGGGGGEGTVLIFEVVGGDGGFAGGGGAGLNDSDNPVTVVSGIAGYGGGQGSATIDGGNPGGGGGAGFGGAIFVRSGALNLNNVTFSNNSAVGGTGAQGKGGSLFLYNGASFNMVPNSVAFSGSTAAAAGLPGQGYSADPYNNNATCPGTDTVDICGIVPTNTLTVTVSGSGTVTDSTGLINCPAVNCAALFQNSAALTAAPTAGNMFSGWSGGGCSGTGPCTVSLAGGSASVAANFVPAIALSIAATHSSPIYQGGPGVITLAVTTSGPTTSSATVSDTIDPSFTINSASTGCAISGQVVTCNMAAGSTSTTFTVYVTASTTAPASVSNTATLTDSGDYVSNGTSTDTITIMPQAPQVDSDLTQLVLSGSTDSPPCTVGGTFTATDLLQNTSPSTLTNPYAEIVTLSRNNMLLSDSASSTSVAPVGAQNDTATFTFHIQLNSCSTFQLFFNVYSQ